MEINIAGERILLTVPASMQNAVRKTEHNVGELYKTWRRDFPKKSEKELLAMMAYQYASFYEQLTRRHENARRTAAEANRLIDSFLREVDSPADVS
ncbi:MAG: cell division protein ZapA [Clostridium sp.]|nr:cell division protein ZapA [Prevotella sp.]MCM1428521.1 cell division protein ZapA [Clostridium sp.]